MSSLRLYSTGPFLNSGSHLENKPRQQRRQNKERSVSQQGKWQRTNPSASKSIRHSSADKTGPARKMTKSKTRTSKGSASQQRMRHSSADRTCAAQRWGEGCALVGVCGAGDGARDAAAGDARDLVAPRHQLVVTHPQRRLGRPRLTKGTARLQLRLGSLAQVCHKIGRVRDWCERTAQFSRAQMRRNLAQVSLDLDLV